MKTHSLKRKALSYNTIFVCLHANLLSNKQTGMDNQWIKGRYNDYIKSCYVYSEYIEHYRFLTSFTFSNVTEYA